jgi:glycosyltransferase involved in cell wall biosynthesis
MMVAKGPEISVIIPTLNEEKYIKYAFEGLENQTFKDFEVIVVDGGSKDSTRKIAKRYAKVVVERARGAGRARNTGARSARGEILLFIDADTRPSKALLSAYAREFRRNEKVVAVTGPILPLEKVPLRVELGYKFVSILFVKASIIFRKPSFIGSNFAVRKEAFERSGGFDANMMTYEDWEFSNRLKKYGRMTYLGDAIVHTSVRRINEWGMTGFFIYYVGNIFAYNLFRKPHTNYAQVR